MRFLALACDYDGTLASGGLVDARTLKALDRARDSGRRLVMVTGRRLDDLLSVFHEAERFDWIVAENGAVLYEPRTRQIVTRGPPPSKLFIDMLRSRGVDPVSVGRVIVATWHPHETTVLEVIRELGLELQVIFNKGAVMVLPSGLNKASGLEAVLDRMALSPHNVVGVGDAENDHALLSVCECSVAVANALPTLKEKVDWVTSAEHGDGVRELIGALVTEDLRHLASRLDRHDIRLGKRSNGAEVHVPAYGAPVLLTGTSGSGKSTLATAFMEQLVARNYQFCVMDPEGDYEPLAPAVVIGNKRQAPDLAEVLRVIESPRNNVVVNLLGIGLRQKAAFAQDLYTALTLQREHTGRPHWIILDEAHQLFPPGSTEDHEEFYSTLFITVHPEHVKASAISNVASVIVVGKAPEATLHAFSEAARLPATSLRFESLEADEAVFWSPREGEPPFRFRREPTATERHRHGRKYAEGELGPDKSFYFRGPQSRLRLRAHNLSLFLEIAEGVDEETWTYHLHRGDYSRWIREAIKDDELARVVASVEQMPDVSARDSLEKIQKSIEAKYTAPL